MRTTNGEYLTARFLPIITSVACESYSAASRASVSAFRSSLPGRSAIAEQLQSSTRRARNPPNEQFARHQLRRPRPRQQPRPRWLRHPREPRSVDIPGAAFDKAGARERPELRQPFRLRALPRLLLQRKLSKPFAVSARLRDSSLLCRLDAARRHRPRGIVTTLLPHWLLRRFQSLGAPIILDDPCARSPKKSNNRTHNKPETRKMSVATFARRREYK